MKRMFQRDPGTGDVPVPSRIAIALISLAINTVIYAIPNRYAPGPHRLLPWTAVDQAVPFVPGSLWVYLSDYVLVASAFFMMRGATHVRRFVIAYFAMLGVGLVFHWFWPTTLPRDAWPVQGDGLVALGFEKLRAFDHPASCLPSMHVAGSYLAAFALWRYERWRFWGWTAWATAVALSTLTAKQHYFVDVIAGLVLAAAVWALCFWWPDRQDRAAAAKATPAPNG